MNVVKPNRVKMPFDSPPLNPSPSDGVSGSGEVAFSGEKGKPNKRK